MYLQTDAGNSVLRRIVISSAVVTTLAGTVGVSGYTDGQGTLAKFSDCVSGATINAAGSVAYIVSYLSL